MKKSEIIKIILLFIVAAVVGVAIGHFIREKKAASDALNKRQADIDTMVHAYSGDDDYDDEEEEEDSVVSETKEQTEESEPYTYVAIGNSLTCNEYPLSVEGLWWSSSAMCVTKPSKDYAHRFRKYLDKKTEAEKDVSLMTIVCKNWENNSDRNYYADIIIESIPEDTKVISIQMGENVTEYKENMAEQFDYLYTGIRNRFPDAKIMLFEEILWPQDDVKEAMYAAAEKNDFAIVDISDFTEKYESDYKGYQGMEVLGDDGNTYVVGDITVAAHPNDEGHKCLAKLLEKTYESISK